MSPCTTYIYIAKYNVLIIYVRLSSSETVVSLNKTCSMYHDRYCIRKSWLGATEKKIATRGAVTRSDTVAVDPGAEEIRTRQAVVQKGGSQFNLDSANSASGYFTPSLFSDVNHRLNKSKGGKKIKGEKKKKGR